MNIYIAKISSEDIVNQILRLDNFIHDGIYNFGSEITENDAVFIYFGGDKSQISWEQGLRAVGKIVRPPFDLGYETARPRNFKIEIQPLHILDASIPPRISKIHRKYAENLYDVPYIGANHFPNQAIAKTDSENSIRSLMNLYTEYTNNEDLRDVWSLIPSLNDLHRGEDGLRVIDFIESIANAGLQIPNSSAIRFVSSLCAKPFVILTGLSGSGKTKLAEAFSLWISEEDSQCCTVAVGADWTNREPLLGFPNALESEKYIKPDNGALNLMLRAEANPDKPFFLILDEMNMSHVERYFADFLSAMESNDRTIALHSGGAGWDAGDDLIVPPSVSLPKNLFIIGTVNIDETTYMFSPKVLDRASVIEFRVSELEMTSFLEHPHTLVLDLLRGRGSAMGIDLVRKAIADTDVDVDLSTSLIPFFSKLKDAGAEFGYRTASEISRFVSICGELAGDAMENEEIIDAAIMQKLLPKLHGSRNKIEKILRIMAQLCLVDINQEPFQDEDEDIKYPLSYEKLKRMHKRVKDDGFTSYAEA